MTTADLIVGRSTADVAEALCQSIVQIFAAECGDSQNPKDSFRIALSGGSLPKFLSALPDIFAQSGIDPQWSKWHVLLADERCVPLDSEDSNLKAIQEEFLSSTSIPSSQVYGINQDLLSGGATTEEIAQDYQATLQRVLQVESPTTPSSSSSSKAAFIDLAVLGFGPDGHTCSLFPNHELLQEGQKWVAGITDSPKPPSDRITLTFRALNHHTRHVILCGAGSSKQPIVSKVFEAHSILPLHSTINHFSPTTAAYSAKIIDPPPFPCAMVHPPKSLTWIVDQEAVCTSMGLLTNVVAEVYASPTRETVRLELCRQIVQACQVAMEARGVFTIALSGGSLPPLLSKLPQVFQEMKIHPHFDKWHVVLADERGVPDDHPDSNMFALKKYFLDAMGVFIPSRQVHGIDVVSLSESIQVAAGSYQTNVLSAIRTSGGLLDLAVLGFGPDGHTCSLFPDHPLLLEREAYVAWLTDSPKSPSHRITFTFRTLNDCTRNVFFCGMGDAKRPILHEILQNAYRDPEHDRVAAHVYPKFPCGMVRPKERLVYIVDDEAMKDVYVSPTQAAAESDEVTNTGPKLLGRRGSSFLPKPAIAKLYVRPTTLDVADELCTQIVRFATKAIAERNAFSIALSGGSLPSLLSRLPQAFEDAGVNPHYDKWLVLLADERCVPEDHPDSNMHAIQKYLLKGLYGQILHQHIYSLDQVSIAESIDITAQDYERKVHTALRASGGMLDLAVLGFGPDGHTCSLFPGHKLLHETKRWVAPITDSPKAPSNRVTLTLPVLNQHTRNILFCGTGDSKSAILKDIFSTPRPKGLHFETDIIPKYPCAMVRPQQELVYLVDQSAMPHVSKLSPPVQYAKVLVADTIDDIPSRLHPLLIQQSQKAIQARGVFSIALSGGSLPSLLSSLQDWFMHLSIDPQWDKWHILLADERCVPLAHEDSNMGSIQKHLLDSTDIPASQIYGIDESLLDEPTSIQARAYESKLRGVLAMAGGMLDVALLGFGPDGHTCSLFPDHPLLQERNRWVAGIDDSPKPPPKRITLTFGVLNEWTRTIIFCGAGPSKKPILEQVFERVEGRQGADCLVRIATNPPPYPSAMVTPVDQLVWVVDAAAMPQVLST